MINRTEICFFQGPHCQCTRFPKGSNAGLQVDYCITVEPEVSICQSAGDGTAQKANCKDYVPQSRPNLGSRINRFVGRVSQGII